MRPAVPVVALAVALAVSGCAPSPRCGLELCDIRQPGCQQALAAVTACLRETTPAMVPVRVIPHEQYLAENLRALSSATDQVRFSRLMGGLSLFDLAPANLVLFDAAEVQSRAAVHYSRRDRAITIVDRGEAMDSHWQVALLIHEYIHALQAARGAPSDPDRDHDQSLAAAAMREGEAVLVEDLAELELFGGRVDEVGWSEVYPRWQAQAVREMVLTPAPLLLSELHFLRAFGTPYLHPMRASAGWQAVEGLVASPPASSRQVVAGAGAPEPSAGPWHERIDQEALPELPASFEPLMNDRLGAWLLEIFLDRIEFDLARRSQGGVAYRPLTNRALAGRLRGDHFSVQDDPTTASTVAAWRLRLDGPVPAQALLDWLSPRLPRFVRVSRRDRDVLLVASNREALLDPVMAGPWKAPPASLQHPGLGQRDW